MIELLAPSSSVAKVNLVFKYGADCTYLGLSEFSLRKRASETTLDDLKKIIEIARKSNKKVYITANVIPHNEELKGAKAFFKKLKKIGVDAVIMSSPYFIKLAKKCGLTPHVSTQQSVSNSYAIKYFESLGAKRVVLARELSLSDIKNLDTKLELEVFIHGGACMSYSGRCVLSNILTGRDANSGDCAHSCRWVYKLYSGNKKISDNPFSLSSKDLMALDVIKDIVSLGNVSSLKIEGRMKSDNYLATVIRGYRMVLDNIKDGKDINYPKIKEDLRTAGGRELGLFNYDDARDNKTQIYDFSPTSPQQTFLGVLEKVANGRAYITIKNRIFEGDLVYFFTSKGDTEIFKISDLRDDEGEKIDNAPHPERTVSFLYDMEIEKGALLKDGSI